MLGIPAANVQGLRRGFIEGGFPPNQAFGISESLADARSLFLTPNTVVVYVLGDASDVKDGPMVLQVPPGVLGILDDAHFRFVTDLGLSRARPGQGRQIPGGAAGLHRARFRRRAKATSLPKSRTYSNVVIMRAFVQGERHCDHREEREGERHDVPAVRRG